ncbi:MAG: hypothetical protein DRP47_08695 [Candidatus Zixiibacteriota bacterium]|nr:MAG: hypothetical protein DRP47_08695 [candidate division Zixibacteria bacterium]
MVGVNFEVNWFAWIDMVNVFLTKNSCPQAVRVSSGSTIAGIMSLSHKSGVVIPGRMLPGINCPQPRVGGPCVRRSNGGRQAPTLRGKRKVAALPLGDKLQPCAWQERPLLGQILIAAYVVDSDSVQTAAKCCGNSEQQTNHEFQKEKIIIILNN